MALHARFVQLAATRVGPGGRQAMWKNASRWQLVALIGCYFAAFALQAPIAWGFAYFLRSRTTKWDEVRIERPQGSDSNIAWLEVVNEQELGFQTVRLCGWSEGRKFNQPIRSRPGEPLNSNPAAPFDSATLHPALNDARAWPTSAQAKPTFVGGTFGETITEIYALGLPWKSVYSIHRRDYLQGKGGTWTHFGSFGFLMSSTPTSTRVLTMAWYPLWLGWIGNTLVHGTVFAAVIVGLPWGWRRMRTAMTGRVGRCPGCGYDLRGTAEGVNCPECGASSRELASLGKD